MAFFNINRVETGNRIAARRKAMHSSREDLADSLSTIGVLVSITSIGKWERGECDISEPHARALAQIFGCKLCELVVAELSFYDDERDQLAPFYLTSICYFAGARLFLPIEAMFLFRCAIYEKMTSVLKIINRWLIEVMYSLWYSILTKQRR